MIKEYIYEASTKIKKYLDDYFLDKRKVLEGINQRWGKHIGDSFLDFAKQGKMVRGGLVVLGYQTFGRQPVSHNVIKAAAAMEIMHSSLLIHDDIMDNDTIRRGQPTMHHYYTSIGKREKLSHPEQFGLSAGICLGDIGFFLSQEIIGRIKVDYAKHIKLNSFFVNEVIKVGSAQLYEMFNTISPKVITRDEVFAVYLHKTARYTFSLPLMLGAMLAGTSKEGIKKLEKLGELMGLVFQFQDDILGMFGQEKTLGKNVGSDMRERKKTLFYLEIFGKRKYHHQKKLQQLFTKKRITKSDIRLAQELIIASGIFDVVKSQQQAYSRRAAKIIKSFDVSAKTRNLYQELLEYNLNRTK